MNISALLTCRTLVCLCGKILKRGLWSFPEVVTMRLRNFGENKETVDIIITKKLGPIFMTRRLACSLKDQDTRGL